MSVMIELILFSTQFPLDEVYNYIGVAGEKIFLNEAKFPMSRSNYYVREKECSITYSTDYIDTIDVEVAVERLFNEIHPREKQIIESIEKYNLKAKFCVVLNLSENPIINLSPNFIDLVSRLHASIEFDTYME